ncbi:MAG TPA: hypothetical protein VMT70_09885 [Vicinamibacteria bacterium]|nr:hypothetical protein [Vicinamibacteria bacterium]
MSTLSAVAVVALASLATSATAADEAPLLDIEGVVGPHVLAPPPAAPAAASPSLHLVWVDPSGAAAAVEAVARGESVALFRKMGAPVTWRRGRANEMARPEEVRVILLDRAAEREPGTPVLGATPARFEADPFVWVHVPSVSAALGLPPRGTSFGLDFPASRALGIALGRVIAHEIVHAFVPWVPHGTGLMSPSLNRSQLTAASMAFDPSVAAALQAALRGEAPLPRPDAGTHPAAVAKEVDR